MSFSYVTDISLMIGLGIHNYGNVWLNQWNLPLGGDCHCGDVRLVWSW
jgi:hypothetical protein